MGGCPRPPTAGRVADSGAIQRGTDGQLRLTRRPSPTRQGSSPRRLGGTLGRRGNRGVHSHQRSGATCSARFAKWSSATPNPGTSPARSRTRLPHQASARPAGSHVRIEISNIEVLTRPSPNSGLCRPPTSTRRSRWRWKTAADDEAHRSCASHAGRSRFRGDDLQLIGFGRQAEVMEIGEARRARGHVGQGHEPPPRAPARGPLRKHPNAQPVSGGPTAEPTSHLEPDGEVYFNCPPIRSPSPPRPRARQLDATWAPTRRSSASATTPAWRASSRRWPSASAVPSHRAGGRRPRRRGGRVITWVAAGGWDQLGGRKTDRHGSVLSTFRFLCYRRSQTCKPER